MKDLRQSEDKGAGSSGARMQIKTQIDNSCYVGIGGIIGTAHTFAQFLGIY